MSLTPRGMSIQEAYRLYADSKFLVNRRYQRKLVWTEQEKQHLIDSIQKNFPIPLFMLANVQHDENAYEIIDGMQRLNAIFGFLEHRFKDEKQRCFDVEQFSRARIQRDAKIFAEYSGDVPRLSDRDCASILEYQLAVTIDTEDDEARINEVFGRINSGGRQLSPQEQRQAGLVSNLSETVRKIAMELRGDDSPDVLALNQMPAVSFNTPRERQGYGVDASDIFWCKHGIITPNDLAKAEDEQVITDIIISILNGKPLNASREVFDDHFTPNSAAFLEIERLLTTYGADRVRNEILSIVSTIRAVFETGDFLAIRSCMQEIPRSSARTAFYALFMAFFNLIHKESKFPDNFLTIRKRLNNAQKALTMAAHYTRTEDREKNIAIITGLVQDDFVKKDVPALGSAHALVVEIENSLRRAKFEASRYEFKIGLCELSDAPRLDRSMFNRLARTAAAIANGSPNADGYIYIGVADNEISAARITKLFGIQPVKIGDAYFTGVAHDLRVLGISMDDYVKCLVAEISKTTLADPLRTQLVTSLDHAEYCGMPFVRLRVPVQKGLTAFTGEYPVRKNSETVNMTPAETLAQSKMFPN